MSRSLDAVSLGSVLEQAGFAEDDREPLIVVTRTPLSVGWASAQALALFDAATTTALEATLFGAGATRFASRLVRLPESGPFRLERLSIAGLATTQVVACHPVSDGPDAFVVLHLPGARAAVPKAPILSGDHAGGVAPLHAITRILWETDGAGIVTRVGPEARLLGSRAPRQGDDLPARLRDIAPSLAEHFAGAIRNGTSVGRIRLEWPREDGVSLTVEVGATGRRDGLPGLRGFLTAHHGIEDRGTLDADEVTVAEPDREAQPDTPKLTPPLEVTEPARREPPREDAEVAPSPDGPGQDGFNNILHFPVMRLGPVPANFVPALRPSPSKPDPDAAEATALPELHWSEAPETSSDSDGLSASERDAFDHIRKVLGTRPSQAASTPDPAATMQRSSPPASSELLGQAPSDLPHIEQDATGDRIVPGDDRASNVDRETGGIDPAPQGSDASRSAGAVHLGFGEHASIVGPPAAGAAGSIVEPDTAAAETLDTFGDGFLRLDDNGIITAVSPKAALLLQAGAETLVGHPVTSILGKGQVAAWHALASGVVPHGSVVHGPVPLQLRTGDGRSVAVLARLGRHGGTLLCGLTLERSAAPQSSNADELARREAERTSALKSEFLAKVSHEIRTPLNAILGFAEVIRDERLGPVGNPRYLEYLRDIHASGTHVMSLVNDLLDLSRIEAGRMDLNLAAVDANAVVQDCVNTLQTEAHRNRIVIRLSLTQRLPSALADERSLRQIVLNLLSNAVKFNEPGGQVIVSTALGGTDGVAIRVRDTGIGMSEDEIAAAMEPFRQLSTVNRTGSGLGLPLTKALVEANCARMTIKSARREGTLVEVVFPLVEQGSVSLPAE